MKDGISVVVGRGVHIDVAYLWIYREGPRGLEVYTPVEIDLEAKTKWDWQEFEEGEYRFVTYPWRQELEEYLDQNFNFTYSDLCGYDDKFNMQLVNTRFYFELAKKINKERAKRGIPLE